MPRKRKQTDLPVVYDKDRHCGVWITKNRRRVRCTALKGSGTPTAGLGPCSQHLDKAIRQPNYFLTQRPTRLHYLIQRVNESGGDPTDIVQELLLLRALLAGFVEDNAELDDPGAILQASELANKVVKAAQIFQQIQQAETLHIRSVKLLEVQMARVMIQMVKEFLPGDEGQRLINRIRDGWGALSIEQDPRKIKEEDLS